MKDSEQLDITENNWPGTGTLFVRNIRNKEGKLHCLTEPAHVRWDKEGNIEHYSWFKNGQFHRLDGPAYFIKSEFVLRKVGDTSTDDEYAYYIEGILYSKEQFEAMFRGVDSIEDKELLIDLGQTFE